jgi:hypothetical protein
MKIIVVNMYLIYTFFPKYFSGNQIKKTEMGRACSTYGGEERCVQSFGGKNWEKEATLRTQA